MADLVPLRKSDYVCRIGHSTQVTTRQIPGIRLTMSGPQQDDLGPLRDKVRRRVSNTSLRNVARQIGMSASGLSKFLNGVNPYTSTHRKLTTWVITHGDPDQDHPSFEATVAAIQILTGFVESYHRAEYAEEIIGSIERGCGRDLPSWFPRLRAFDWESV